MTEEPRDFATRPAACPFVALDDDRDRRSDVPDRRHRCYAEPTPQPRALAHQEAYCLSEGFAGCPIFLDWAARAAADPVPTRETVGTERLLLSDPVDAAAPVDLAARGQGTDPARDQASQAAPPWATPPPWRTGQLSAFPDDSDDLHSGTVTADERGSGSERGVSSQPGSAMPGATRSGGDRPPSSVGRPSALVGRPSPPVSGRPRQAHPAPMEEDQEPEWSRPRRFEPYAGLGRRRRLSLSPVLLGLVGLALAAVVLFALPGFLSGVAAPTRSPSAVAVITPSPSPSPTPEPTPVAYEVEPGDTMERIARMFALTIDQIACANGIVDVDRLSIGQILIIPDDDFQCPDTSGAPSPSG